MNARAARARFRSEIRTRCTVFGVESPGHPARDREEALEPSRQELSTDRWCLPSLRCPLQDNSQLRRCEGHGPAQPLSECVECSPGFGDGAIAIEVPAAYALLQEIQPRSLLHLPARCGIQRTTSLTHQRALVRADIGSQRRSPWQGVHVNDRGCGHHPSPGLPPRKWANVLPSAIRRTREREIESDMSERRTECPMSPDSSDAKWYPADP